MILDPTNNKSKEELLEDELKRAQNLQDTSLGNQFKKDVAGELVKNNSKYIDNSLKEAVSEQAGISDIQGFLQYVSQTIDFWKIHFPEEFIMTFIISKPGSDTSNIMVSTGKGEDVLKAVQAIISLDTAKKIQS